MSAPEKGIVPVKRCASISITSLASMLFALATLCGDAFGQSESAPPTTEDNKVTLFTEDTATWGRATRVVLPDYPPDALEKGIGADVLIKLVINVLGGVKSITSIIANPKIPEFEAAVRGVVNTWQFKVPSDKNCVPLESAAVEVVLQFTVVDGKGKMFLTHDANPYKLRPNRRRVKFLNGDDGPRVTYPVSGVASRAQANVYTKLTIDPQSGKITDSKIVHILTAEGAEAEFSRAVQRGLRYTQFVPMPEYSSPVTVCLPFEFRRAN